MHALDERWPTLELFHGSFRTLLELFWRSFECLLKLVWNLLICFWIFFRIFLTKVWRNFNKFEWSGNFRGMYVIKFNFFWILNFLQSKEKSILIGASSNNLNTVHMGYHYPRSIVTAKQSLDNYNAFIKKFNNCIKKKIKSYYFIASSNSKISFNTFWSCIC